MISTILPRRLARWACAAVALGLTAGAHAASENVVSLITIEPVATETLRPVERTFLQRAAELGRQQFQLARLATSQATGSDVRTFAQQWASDSRQLTDSVEALQRKRGVAGGSSRTGTTPGYEQMLEKTGGTFDREFVRVAGELQAATLRLFEEIMADARDPDVRELAGSYLPVLRDHHNRGTELRKAYE